MPKKRQLSEVSAPPSKRHSQATPKPKQPLKTQPKTTTQYVYLAIEEEYGPYMETAQNVFEVYATVEDANQKLLTRQAGPHVAHFEEWETTYDKDGCFHSKAEDGEGDGCRFDVRRMEVKPSGCSVAKRGKRMSGDDDVGEEDGEEDGEIDGR